jgi:hypothetical protein
MEELEKDEFGGDLPIEKPKITPEMRTALREEFPDGAYSQHPTKTFLTTLKAAYVMERINDVFGIGRWNLHHSVVSHEKGYVLMKGRLIISDYDCIVPEQYGGHSTEGKNTELADGYKSAITDMLSKSASYLEIGLEMFKGNINPGGGGGNKNQQSEAISKEQFNDFYSLWNGKVYKGNYVYWNDVKYKLTDDQATWLKHQSKYKDK